MKKIFKTTLALAAIMIVLASCSKNEAPTSEAAQKMELSDKPIAFGVEEFAEASSTRAFTETTASTMQTNGFKVAGIWSSGSATLFNADATYSSTAKTYSTATKYYFPTTGTVSFYAVTPKTQAISITSGAASLSYTHDSDIDLMAAKSETVSPTSSAVALTFDHLLTQVKFTATGGDGNVSYKVKSLSLKAPASATYAYASGTLTAGTAMTSGQAIISSTKTLSGKTDMGFTGTFIPGSATVACEWECYVNSTLVGSYSKTATVTLTQGKKNTINLTLPNADGKPISFSVTVNAWGTNEDKNITLS